MKPFNKLSPAQKRVAVARDVLQRLESRSIKAQSCTLVDFRYSGDQLRKKLPETFELQDALPNLKCNACALGAAFISVVGLDNKFKLCDFEINAGLLDFKRVFERLKEVFGENQLKLLEALFENEDGAFSLDTDNAALFSKRLPKHPRRRMVALMENIIKNKGTLVVPKIK